MISEPIKAGWVEVATQGQGSMLHWVGEDGYPLCGVPGEWPHILSQTADLGLPYCSECLEKREAIDRDLSRLL